MTTTIATRRLTARGVRAMLTRAGVDHTALTIADDPTVWRDLETGVLGNGVVVTGPKEARHAAGWVLLDRGLANAPYPDRDEWSR